MKKSQNHNYAVIMAGGSGTRLWPLSRKDLPKQVQKFVSDKTLLNETIDRLIYFLPANNVYITTTQNFGEKIKELAPNIPHENIIVEPQARGTTAALALATSFIFAKDKNAMVFYVASDHVITNIEKFGKTLSDAFSYVSKHTGRILLVGIKPTRPDTGLGYIKKKDKLQQKPFVIYSVDKFVEKPSYKIAKQYVESGDYFWNSAYYCFKAQTLLKAYEDTDPNITENITRFLKTKNPKDFNKVPVKPHEIEIIDSKKYPLALIPADFDWSDIGNWRSLHEILATISGNSLVAHSNRHIDLNSQNCLIVSKENKLVATVGLDNIIIVDTPDVLLVLNRDQTQEVKKLLEEIKANGLSEYL